MNTLAFTPAQRLLLQVILSAPDQALPAWDRWEALTDWRAAFIDQGSYRLLPLVYRRLSAAAPSHPSLPVLKGLYLRSWYENTRQVRLCLPALQALRAAGLPLLLFKGAPLSALYYHDRAARSFTDVDFLVPEAEAFRALDLLLGLGWVGMDPELPPAVVLRHLHAVGLVHPTGGCLDLHRCLLQQTPVPGLDLPAWSRAQPFDLEGLPLLALSPADELLQACLHGLLWNSVPSLRWVADAAMILAATGPAFDWDVFLTETQRRQTSLLALSALTCLVTDFGIRVPPGVLASLNRRPHALFERAELRLVTRSPGWLPETLLKRPFAYIRLAGNPTGPRWWLGLLRYILSYLMPPRWSDFPAWALRRLRAKDRKLSSSPRS